jgi:hypothetical protein
VKFLTALTDCCILPARLSLSAALPIAALFIAALWLLIAAPASAQDKQEQAGGPAAARQTLIVEFKTEDSQQQLLGEVVQEFADGSLLFLSSDGQLWTLNSQQILSREPSDAPMQPLGSEQIYLQLREQLAPGFQIFKTKHYVIVYNTSGAYATWVGELFERLYRGFYNYWQRHHRWELQEPRFPLVAVVFRDKSSYLQFAEREVGESAQAMIGYYNMKTNRMAMYDLTGVNEVAPSSANTSNARIINHILSQPRAERTVATIVHEAVHQIAYNSGLQVRLADNPRWLSEGLAMYFESPDFSSRAGWSMGKVNYHNFGKFAQYLPRRPEDSLTRLIASDSRLLQGSLAADAYPESWALTYFLMKARKDDFRNYLQDLAKLPPLGESSERQRVELFKQHFGQDLQELDKDFIRFMHKVR